MGKKISALGSATTLTGAELLEVVQSGSTVQSTTGAIAGTVDLQAAYDVSNTVVVASSTPVTLDNTAQTPYAAMLVLSPDAGEAYHPGVGMLNLEDAVDGTQQYSPSLLLGGAGFGTTAGASELDGWAIQARPVQGLVSSCDLAFLSSLDDAAMGAPKATLSSDGDLTVLGKVLPDADGDQDLGASDKRWSAVWANVLYGKWLILAPVANTSGSQNDVSYTAPAHTGLTASTEAASIIFDISATKTWAAGETTEQSAFKILAPTFAFDGASTITDAATVYIDAAPTAGGNATITNSYAIWVDGGVTRLDGDLDHRGTKLGFYGTTPIAKQTGVGTDAASIHAALVALGLISA